MSSHIETVRFQNGIEADVVHPRNGSASLRLLFVLGAFGWISGLFKKWLEFCHAHGITAYVVNIQPGDNVSIDDYARIVSEIADEIGPVVLIGHSMGGLIAQMVAATNRNVIGAVFMTSAASRGTKGRFLKNPLFWSHPRYLWAMTTGKLFKLTKSDFMKHFVTENTPNPEGAFETLAPESGLVFREVAIGVEVGPISYPTLVVGGTHDKVLPPVIQKEIAKKYGSEYLEFPTGHLVQLEDVGDCRYFRQILNWVKRSIAIPAMA